MAWNASIPVARAAPECRQLDPALPWYGDVRQRLQAAIDANSTCTGTWKRPTKAVAFFDWDNTEVKNDIADATLAWMLRHVKVRQPATSPRPRPPRCARCAVPLRPPASRS